MKNKPTFLFHDYETYGKDAIKDRPSQYAAIRTDENLNIIGEDTEYYCFPQIDTIPSPIACLITGITPNNIIERSRDPVLRNTVFNEYDFFKKINAQFSEPNTCVLGFNTLEFDDEVTRHGLYRNMFSPYEREWKNGCSRWDMINVVRAFAYLFPDDIKVPVLNGKPVFKLEYLGAENNLDITRAHDAVSDVYTTIALAKLIKEKQPKFWDYTFSNKGKKQVMQIVEKHNNEMLFACSSYFGYETKYIQPVFFVKQDANDNNNFIMLKMDDLDNIKRLLSMDAENVQEALYAQLSEGEKRIPIHMTKINQCPILFSAEGLEANGVITKEEFIKNTPKYNEYLDNFKFVQENQSEIFNLITKAFASRKGFKDTVDPDIGLYSEFIPTSDNPKMETFHHHIKDGQMLQYLFKRDFFTDNRLNQLSKRIIMRNFMKEMKKEITPENEANVKKVISHWFTHCYNRWHHGYSIKNDENERSVTYNLKEFYEEVEEAKAKADTPEKQKILADVVDYVEKLNLFFENRLGIQQSSPKSPKP